MHLSVLKAAGAALLASFRLQRSPSLSVGFTTVLQLIAMPFLVFTQAQVGAGAP